MPDDTLIARLDRFVIGLLDEAEARCAEPAANDTSTSEDNPGKPAASLQERIAALKAITAYIAARNRLDGGEAPEDEPGEPSIVDFERRIKRGNRRR